MKSAAEVDAEPQLIRLSQDTIIPEFDCSDDDLNDFIKNDAKPYQSQLLAVTYLLIQGGELLAFFCVSNDKISVEEFTGSLGNSKNQWVKKFSKKVPHPKRHLKSFPAVKIGRLAVSKKNQKSGIGKMILDYISYMFITNNRTGCRYIVVDAYAKSIGYYQKNGFDFLTTDDVEAGKHTRLMYFDLNTLV